MQMRHMRSLRSMRRDNGWIHTLLEEAENERMVSNGETPLCLTISQLVQAQRETRIAVMKVPLRLLGGHRCHRRIRAPV